MLANTKLWPDWKTLRRRAHSVVAVEIVSIFNARFFKFNLYKSRYTICTKVGLSDFCQLNKSQVPLYSKVLKQFWHFNALGMVPNMVYLFVWIVEYVFFSRVFFSAYKITTILLDGKRVRLCIWDTSGMAFRLFNCS